MHLSSVFSTVRRDDGKRLWSRQLYILPGPSILPPSLFSFFSPVFYSLLSLPKPEYPVCPQADQDQQCGGKEMASLVWWLFPALEELLVPPESQGLSVRTCLGDDSAQAQGYGTDVRAVWRPWQVPPDAFPWQDVGQGTAGRGAMLHGHFEEKKPLVWVPSSPSSHSQCNPWAQRDN